MPNKAYHSPERMRRLKRLRSRVKIHHEGTNILIALFLTLLAINAVIWLFLPPPVIPVLFTALSVVCYSFVFNFFRCPRREYTGSRRNAVVSSVDGKVVAIEEVEEPEYIKGRALQVSVFMSPLNVHANWYPVEGTVEYVRHHRGRFLSAYLPKASILNERSSIGILCEGGQRITVRQVAGAMARRIVTYARKGHKAEINEHLGFIKFGSRVDLYLPVGTTVHVNIGDNVRGDITHIATMPEA